MDEEMRQIVEDQLFLLAGKCQTSVKDVAYALTSESVMRAIIAEVVIRK